MREQRRLEGRELIALAGAWGTEEVVVVVVVDMGLRDEDGLLVSVLCAYVSTRMWKIIHQPGPKPPRYPQLLQRFPRFWTWE